MSKMLEAMHALLGRPEEELVQMLYLRLANGKVLVFIGAPVSEEDAEQVKEFVFAEQIPACLIGLTAQASGTTAQ
jgi:hypothetical protein